MYVLVTSCTSLKVLGKGIDSSQPLSSPSCSGEVGSSGAVKMMTGGGVVRSEDFTTIGTAMIWTLSLVVKCPAAISG